jgi:hypothetical protein
VIFNRVRSTSFIAALRAQRDKVDEQIRALIAWLALRGRHVLTVPYETAAYVAVKVRSGRPHRQQAGSHFCIDTKPCRSCRMIFKVERSQPAAALHDWSAATLCGSQSRIWPNRHRDALL